MPGLGDIRHRSGTLARRLVRPVLAVGIGVALLIALRVSGSLADTAAALEVMGFDPDRARLITDLIADAEVVAVATLATRSAPAAAVAGMLGGGALFLRTFLDETRQAIRASAGQGSFDVAGWVLTGATLAVAFAIAAWAAAVLAGIVRRVLLGAWSDVVSLVRGRRTWRLAARPSATLVGILLVVTTVPVFGDMVNYAPDVHMRTGDSGLIGLVQAGRGVPAAGSPGPAGPTGPTLLPGSPVAGAAPAAASAVLRPGRSWAAWRPSGHGSVATVRLPAPWVGGTAQQAQLDVYLPPGYATSNRAYPVIYEVPWGLSGGWSTGLHVTGILDTLIDSGTIPASIVVFVGEAGGPYPSGECVDSTDHRQWLERYVTDTVVPYVDGQFRTIATAAARSVLGFSAGGYCAPMLTLRHPDLFSTAIAFSGYYQAGIHSNETPNAWRPFGGSSAAEAAYSPLVLAGQVSPADRSHLFFELSASPTEGFFGPQYTAFATALNAAGIPVALFPSARGHSWQGVRSDLPAILQTLGQRESALGVFG